jgi:hypothetical protein
MRWQVLNGNRDVVPPGDVPTKVLRWCI